MSLESSRRRKETTTSGGILAGGGVVLLCTNGLKSKLQSRKLVPAFDQSPSEVATSCKLLFLLKKEGGEDQSFTT